MKIVIKIIALIVIIILITLQSCTKPTNDTELCKHKDKQLEWQYVGINHDIDGAIRYFDRDCEMTVEEQELKCGCNFQYNQCKWKKI